MSPLTREEFRAAAAAFSHLETALLGGGPMQPWQRDALMQMGRIATVTDTDDDAEQAKRIPGPAVLAANIWTISGRGRGGKPVDNRGRERTAVSRARKRRTEGNAL